MRNLDLVFFDQFQRSQKFSWSLFMGSSTLGSLIDSFYKNLLIKGPRVRKQRPQNHLEMMKFVKKTRSNCKSFVPNVHSINVFLMRKQKEIYRTIFKSRLLCDIFFVQKDELSIHHRMNGKKIIQYPLYRRIYFKNIIHISTSCSTLCKAYKYRHKNFLQSYFEIQIQILF